VSALLDFLVGLVERLGHWGYVIIFLGATLESAAFVGFVVPGESLVLVAGFLAAVGVLDVAPVLVVVALGAVIGDSIGYELGRRLGRSWLERFGPRLGLHEERIADVDRFFADHGGKAVLLGRFVGFLRALAPFVAGASRMPYPRFLFYNATGGVLWAVSFVLLGYVLGASWYVAERWIGRATLIGAAVVGVIVVGLWLLRRRRQRVGSP
jgi:membrane protein DedA with SNARE-associated domain